MCVCLIERARRSLFLCVCTLSRSARHCQKPALRPRPAVVFAPTVAATLDSTRSELTEVHEELKKARGKEDNPNRYAPPSEGVKSAATEHKLHLALTETRSEKEVIVKALGVTQAEAAVDFFFFSSGTTHY